jgi:hypothetical protein
MQEDLILKDILSKISFSLQNYNIHLDEFLDKIETKNK